MAGMGETCNHVAAATDRVEATVRIGLTILPVQAMTVSGCQIEKLLNQKR